MMPDDSFEISHLGECRVPSPLDLSTMPGDELADFVPDSLRVLRQIEIQPGETANLSASFERAGPRARIFFEPAQTTAAIVTCGGLCPGLNHVIRALFYELHSNYGVPRVLGVRYGYEGLNPAVGVPPAELTAARVDGIHNMGGTILGTSRGFHDPAVMVDFLVAQDVQMLFCVGGDGTQRGAHALHEEIHRRGLKIAVVGVPKTIDNDIPFVWRSFGFQTAVEQAREVIAGAHNEARSVRNGVSLVKLMGRHAGFIAARATLASGDVNFCFVPEVPFELDGPDGLLARLERRLAARQHAVIVVAEGAGQNLLGDLPPRYDASGNLLPGAIGPFLKAEIERHFTDPHTPHGIRYFDPSYSIRSVPANAEDGHFAAQLASRAAHAAMAGKTDLLIGLAHNLFIHVPLTCLIGQIKRIAPDSELWMSVLAATGQERW